MTAKGFCQPNRVPLVCPVCGKGFTMISSKYKSVVAAGVIPTNSRKCAKMLHRQNLYRNIEAAVNTHIDKDGGIYTYDIVKTANTTRIAATNWLKENKFVKPHGTASRYWVNHNRGRVGL